MVMTGAPSWTAPRPAPHQAATWTRDAGHIIPRPGPGVDSADVTGRRRSSPRRSASRRLRELLIDLVSEGNYQLVVNLEKVGFLDSTGLGVLVGGLKRVRAHDGSLDLVCTREQILRLFRITGLTKVFGIYETVDRITLRIRTRDGSAPPKSCWPVAEPCNEGGAFVTCVVSRTGPPYCPG
jgi:anti-anti-sigma factor